MISKLHESLLKYKNPNLVSARIDNKKPKVGSGKAEKAKTKAERDQDYLNSILPPQEYMENGALWIKYVSPQPAT